MLTAATLRPKTCAHCQSQFMPARPLQSVCSPICARRKVEADKKSEKAAFRARKDAAKPLRKLIEEAQTAFNAFIRLRDAGLPCICCGKPFEPEKPGGSADAGHFRSRGAAPQLRFDEDNVFAQRKNCNRPGGATYAAFRAGVVARIGEERVQRLESSSEIIKWDRETLRQIKTIYLAKARELRRERA